MAKGKKYVDASKKYDKAELHEPTQAFELVKSLASRNFDETVAKITKAQVREIAEIKMPDVNAIDIEGAMAQVAGTARSMGIDVEA